MTVYLFSTQLSYLFESHSCPGKSQINQIAYTDETPQTNGINVIFEKSVAKFHFVR